MLLFAGGTIPSGARADNPGAYLDVGLAFLPVGLLVVLFLRWAVAGRLERPA